MNRKPCKRKQAQGRWDKTYIHKTSSHNTHRSNLLQKRIIFFLFLYFVNQEKLRRLIIKSLSGKLHSLCGWFVCVFVNALNWFYIIILICCLYPFVCLNYANCFLLHSIYITRLCTEAILYFLYYCVSSFFMQGNNIEKIRMLLQHNAHGMIQLFFLFLSLFFLFCFIL